jgi:hypothetical protein
MNTYFYTGFFQVSVSKNYGSGGPYRLYVTPDETITGEYLGKFNSVKEARIAAFEYVIEQAEDALSEAREGLADAQKETE